MVKFVELVGSVSSILALIVRLALLSVIAAVALKWFGVRLPVATPGGLELAYLAGAYWLTR